MKLEICILAGGLSTRLGQDKARLRFGRRTMLSIIRDEAAKVGYPVRVIRRDLVPRCGPLGGIYTALKTTRADAVLFLACDMPFVEKKLLDLLLRRARCRAAPISVFTTSGAEIGFPLCLPKTETDKILGRIGAKDYALKSLCRALHATILAVPRNLKPQL